MTVECVIDNDVISNFHLKYSVKLASDKQGIIERFSIPEQHINLVYKGSHAQHAKFIKEQTKNKLSMLNVTYNKQTQNKPQHAKFVLGLFFYKFSMLSLAC